MSGRELIHRRGVGLHRRGRTTRVRIPPAPVLVLALALALWPGLTVPAAASPACSPKRLLIPVVQYLGASSGPAANDFELFIGILDEKIGIIRNEFPDIDYIKDLSLLFAGHGRKPFPPFNADADALRYWRESESLKILQGSIWSKDDVSYAKSKIVLGELTGRFLDSIVTLRLPIVDEAVPTTLDSHSMITYFALMMDAKRMRCDQGIINHFKSKAFSALCNIKRKMNSGRGYGLDPKLIDIFEKILGPCE